MEELKKILEQLNYPIAYDHFNEPTSSPYIIYRRFSTSNFGADNKVYKKINNVYVGLYTKKKDIVLEKELDGYTEYKKKVKYRMIPFVW